MIDLEKKYDVQDNGNFDKLDLTGLDIEVDVPDINKYPNEDYAILRKHGLGTSDSSILCGVNPYTTIEELIQEKCRNYLTPEEKEIGNKTAVRKGRDLEPFIISKFSDLMQVKNIKPSDMYRHKEFPWLKFNFDGVLDKTEQSNQYIPNEIKVVTMYGMKHYDRTKAWYRERMGYFPLPENHANENNSIETKAAEYGIPPYYYTQLQQQIFGLNAPFGYLTVLFDSDWEMCSFYIYRDDATISTILANGFKTWTKIINITRDPNRDDTKPVIERLKHAENVRSGQMDIGYHVVEEA